MQARSRNTPGRARLGAAVLSFDTDQSGFEVGRLYCILGSRGVVPAQRENWETWSSKVSE
jgi:hypothetical protein